MNTRTTALALTLVFATALAACGSGDKRLSATEYKTKLAALDKQDSKAHANVDGLPHAKSVTQMTAGLTAFAAAEQRLGRQVASLKPPKNAEQANAALAKAFRDSAADMQHVKAAIANAKTPQQALQTIGKLGPKMTGGPELDSALGQLKKLGYANGA
jgi:hypothetical protein